MQTTLIASSLIKYTINFNIHLSRQSHTQPFNTETQLIILPSDHILVQIRSQSLSTTPKEHMTNIKENILYQILALQSAVYRKIRLSSQYIHAYIRSSPSHIPYT